MEIKELLLEKERHFKDLEECSRTFERIRNWIWVDATLRRLKREIAELKKVKR